MPNGIEADVVIPVRFDCKALVTCFSCFAHVWVVDSENSLTTRLVAERHGASYLVFS
jgi:hypothetical protein